jgi:hypothetical protein
MYHALHICILSSDLFVFHECAARQRRTAIIRILADMDAGQALPTNCVSFGTTGLALFLKKIGKVIMQCRTWEIYQRAKCRSAATDPNWIGVGACITTSL